jgi:hypothetical protein
MTTPQRFGWGSLHPKDREKRQRVPQPTIVTYLYLLRIFPWKSSQIERDSDWRGVIW